jgi:MFS family permease
MFQALRIRDFRLLWGGSVISSLGTWLLVLAIPAHVLLVTGSLRDTGLTLAAQYLPVLILGPVAGVLTDRWDRRRLMIATSLFRAGAVAVMLLGTAPGRYWVLYGALIAESSGGVLYLPAWQARTPAIVGTGSLLSSANSLNALADGAVRLIGGPLGGILLAALGVRWLILADALSYLVSAAANALTSRPDRTHATRTTTITEVARDLAEGARVLRGHPVARALLLVTVIFLAANASLSAMLIPLGIRRLGGGENTGFVLSALGVGFLLAAPLLRALLDRVQPRILLAATLAATAAGQFGLFTSVSLATALPAAVAIGTFGSMSEVIPQTVLQRVIPNAVLGRISAVFLTGEAAVGLIGALAGPFLAQAIHLTGLAIVASLVTLAAAALTRLTVPPHTHQRSSHRPRLSHQPHLRGGSGFRGTSRQLGLPQVSTKAESSAINAANGTKGRCAERLHRSAADTSSAGPRRAPAPRRPVRPAAPWWPTVPGPGPGRSLGGLLSRLGAHRPRLGNQLHHVEHQPHAERAEHVVLGVAERGRTDQDDQLIGQPDQRPGHHRNFIFSERNSARAAGHLRRAPPGREHVEQHRARV